MTSTERQCQADRNNAAQAEREAQRNAAFNANVSQIITTIAIIAVAVLAMNWIIGG